MKQKHVKKSLISFALLMAMVFSVQITAAAASTTTVTQVTTKYYDDTRIALEWEKVDGARYYCVQWSATSDFTNASAISSYKTVARSYTIKELTGATSLYVRVGWGTDSSNCEANFSDPIEVVTAPEMPESVSFVGAAAKTATISWPAVTGATSYIVTYNNEDIVVTTNKCVLTYVAGENTATVKSVRTSAAGYAATSYESSKVSNITALTKKIKKSDITLINAMGNELSNGCGYNLAKDVYGTGFEIQYYSFKTKKTVTKKIGWNIYANDYYFPAIKSNQAFKFRVRAYATLTDGTKATGTWSDWRYLVKIKSMKEKNWLYSKTDTKAQFRLTWGKLPGVSKIKMQISTKNGSYKKVATIKGTKKKYTFTKIGKKSLKKEQTYYVKLTFYVKDGKKTYTSTYIYHTN